MYTITGQGIDLDYCDTEWFALEIKRDHSVVFETAKKKKKKIQGFNYGLNLHV